MVLRKMEVNNPVAQVGTSGHTLSHLGGGEGLVTTLVTKNPKTSTSQTGSDPVGVPENKGKGLGAVVGKRTEPAKRYG